MSDHIPPHLRGAVEPQGSNETSPSAERIKQLALQKRSQHIQKNEGTNMKKTPFRMLLIASLVCLLSITTFAAFGGLNFIRGIFGDSSDLIADAVVTPLVQASANGRDLAIEAMVTDGYVTNLVVSLTGARPAEQELFDIGTSADLRSVGWYELEAFSRTDKTYYAVDFSGEQRFDSADIVLSLHPAVAPIELSVTVENRLGNAVVRFPAEALSGRTHLTELQISPMGFLLIGREDNAEGGLPSTTIRLVYAGGKSEVLEVEFATSDEQVGGGGGAIVGARGDSAPLVTQFHGIRNPDGELVINGQFSRIIDPATIEKVVIDGMEYSVD